SPVADAANTATLSLHGALPICRRDGRHATDGGRGFVRIDRRCRFRRLRLVALDRLLGGEGRCAPDAVEGFGELRHLAERLPAVRSEEHTSELQSRENLVCRLLL